MILKKCDQSVCGFCTWNKWSSGLIALVMKKRDSTFLTYLSHATGIETQQLLSSSTFSTFYFFNI